MGYHCVKPAEVSACTDEGTPLICKCNLSEITDNIKRSAEYLKKAIEKKKKTVHNGYKKENGKNVFKKSKKRREWRIGMSISYDKLWSLLRANKMKKKDLAKAAQLTQYAMTKLNNNRPVSMEIMLRLCKIFHCDIGDVMEVVEEDDG